MFYVGVDYHKDLCVACIMKQTGKVDKTIEFPATPEGMDLLISMMKGRKYKVLGESTTYSIDLHNHLVEQGIESYLVDAKSLKYVTKSHKKTDKNDAEAIATYLRLWSKGEIMLSISYVVKGDSMKLRDLCRLREDFAQQKGQELQRIKSHMRRNAEYVEFEDLSTQKALNILQERFADDFTLMERVKTYTYITSRCDNIDKIVENYAEDNSDIRLLASIPGVGILTATELMSMIVTIDRFETADKMRSFFGMAPNVRDSGNSVKHGHITKQGDPMMRQILNRMINTYFRWGGRDLKEYYDSHVGANGKMKTRMAACNKLLDRIFAVLKRKTSYIAY